MGMYQTVNICYGIKTTVRNLRTKTIMVGGKPWNLLSYINEWPDHLPGWLHCYTEEDEPWAVVGAKLQSELRTVDRIVAPGVQQIESLSDGVKQTISSFLHQELGLEGNCEYYIVVTW